MPESILATDFQIVEPTPGWQPANFSWLPSDHGKNPRLLRVDPFREATSAPNARNTFSLPKDANYDGFFAAKRPEDVACILSEAIEYFGLEWQPIPPKPYDGMFGQRELKRDEVAEEVWCDAMQLLHSMALGKPRSVDAAWQAIRRRLRAIKVDAVKAHVSAEMAQRAHIEVFRDEAAQVYFIASESGPIKIGMAMDPVKRLAGLQTAHHDRLSILATCGGGRKQESKYHSRFRAHRLAGEWFTRCPAILAEIARLTGEAGRG